MQWKTPGGKILQVVTTHKSDTWGSSSNNSFHDVTGLTVSITPSSTSNKIFLIISLGVLGTNNNTAGVRVYRGSTVIGSGDGDGSRPTFAFGSHQRGDYHQSGVTYHIVDSPSTTSSVTYKIAAGVHGSGTVYVNRTNGDQNNSNLESGRRSSNITAMEVAG